MQANVIVHQGQLTTPSQSPAQIAIALAAVITPVAIAIISGLAWWMVTARNERTQIELLAKQNAREEERIAHERAARSQESQPSSQEKATKERASAVNVVPTNISPISPGEPTQLAIHNNRPRSVFLRGIVLTGDWVRSSKLPKHTSPTNQYDVVFDNSCYHQEKRHYCGAFESPMEIPAYSSRRLQIGMALPTKGVFSLKGRIELQFSNGDKAAYENCEIDVVENIPEGQIAYVK